MVDDYKDALVRSKKVSVSKLQKEKQQIERGKFGIKDLFQTVSKSLKAFPF